MLQEIDLSQPLWVFGYGSLIWHPGFPVEEQAVARLNGYHRAFCMTSIHYRGTPDHPGLVLALDAADGAICDGLAFRVMPGAEADTLAALRERELVSYAYREELVPLRLRDGRTVQALTYVIERDHAQYRGGLALEDQAQIIARACGGRGPNCDYLFNTAEHLTDLGLSDPDLDWLAARVRALAASDRG
jgi:cation transport protein ChaC